MMFPIKMAHKYSENSTPNEVLVYNIEHSSDIEGNIVASFATCWQVKQKNWIVVPLWELTPIFSKKKLNEEMK